jgi:hypothetical protein
VTTIGMQEARSTTAFRVVEPRGLPAGARLVSIRRIGDPETGHPSVLFQYSVGGRPFEILEMGTTPTDAIASRTVRASSSALPEPHGPTLTIVAPMITGFRAGWTRIYVSTAARALTDAQVDAVRKAMTGRATFPGGPPLQRI